MAELGGDEEGTEKCEGVMPPYNSSTEENRNGKETAGRISSEDKGIVIEIKGQHETEGDETGRQLEVKKICSGAPILATQSYTKNPDSPMGKKLDLRQGDALSYTMEHEYNEHG